MAGGRSPRQKGNRTERALRHFLLQRGLTAERVPLSGSAGGRFAGDLLLTLAGRDHIVEVKCRGNGFAQLYEWLDGRDLLIVKADRRDPLIVLPLSLAAEIAVRAKMSDAERNAADVGPVLVSHPARRGAQRRSRTRPFGCSPSRSCCARPDGGPLAHRRDAGCSDQLVTD
jgi:Holliday junction resolvase